MERDPTPAWGSPLRTDQESQRRSTGGTSPAPATAALPERYEDLGGIARGGWGEVRRVRDRVLDRVVAMKILATEHLEADVLLARFMNEAQVTAALEHPGIVPVHDRGILPDRRPWFTMKEVRGRTLHDILHETESEGDAARRLRRLVEILHRVAETVGYAHQRGVIHRDLKPGNVMVGEFGEVLVLDWGIARSPHDIETSGARDLLMADAALTGTGEILGTVAYMPPEQGRGIGEPLTPAADVFALGLILYEILVGERARPFDRVQAWAMAAMGSVPPIVPSRAIPEELTQVVLRATAPLPEKRPAHGMALGELIQAWLDGSLRRERAAALVAQAGRTIAGLDVLRAARDAKRAQARRILETVRDHDPVERKLPAWNLEDQAEALHQEIDLIEAAHVETLRAALELDPEHEAAHRDLAALYRAQILDAEARRAPAEVARAELRLRHHARGEHDRFLKGLGRVVLATDPPGLTVRASRYVLEGRRLVPSAPKVIGESPIDVELEAGSWRLEIARPDGGLTCVPAQVVRDGTFQPKRPDPRRRPEEDVVRCIAVGADEAHVPAGWAVVGGDSHAVEPVPGRSVWIDDFVIQRTSVTFADYLAFLDDLDPEEALVHAPRFQQGTAHDPSSVPLVERVEGRFVITRPGEGGHTIDLRWPVTSIDWYGARAYAAWMARRTGLPWRLPDELEWEKAARGVDGRTHPWGDFGEPTWARIVGSTAEVPCRAPVGAHPIDQSPYGVLDVVGNARNWCAGPWTPDGPSVVDGLLHRVECSAEDPALRAVRGGSWSSVASLARCASRFAGRADERFTAVGLRLVRSL